MDAYQELCGSEIQEELLESAYLRRIALELEQNGDIALATAREALSRIPNSKQLAEKSLDVLAGMEAMKKEEFLEEIEILEGFYPELRSLENYFRAKEVHDPESEAK